MKFFKGILTFIATAFFIHQCISQFTEIKKKGCDNAGRMCSFTEVYDPWAECPCVFNGPMDECPNVTCPPWQRWYAKFCRCEGFKKPGVVYPTRPTYENATGIIDDECWRKRQMCRFDEVYDPWVPCPCFWNGMEAACLKVLCPDWQVWNGKSCMCEGVRKKGVFYYTVPYGPSRKAPIKLWKGWTKPPAHTPQS